MPYNRINASTLKKPDLGDTHPFLHLPDNQFTCLAWIPPDLSYLISSVSLTSSYFPLYPSKSHLRQKTAFKNNIRRLFLEERPQQQVPHEQALLCATKTKGNPDKVSLHWSKCGFAQLLQAREDMGLIWSSQPSSAVTDAAWNWRRNDDARPFPSRRCSVTMEADSMFSTSLSAK